MSDADLTRPPTSAGGAETAPQRPPTVLDNFQPTTAPRQSHLAAGVALFTALTFMGAVFVAIIMAGASGSRARGAMIVGVPVAALGLLSWVCYRSPKWRGVAFGIWIGLALGLLADGVCFALLFRR